MFFSIAFENKKKMKTLKEICMEKTCGKSQNFENYQAIYDYLLYCRMMSFINVI